MKYRFYYNNPVNVIDTGHPFWFGSTNTHQSTLDSQITLKPSDVSGVEHQEYSQVNI